MGETSSHYCSLMRGPRALVVLLLICGALTSPSQGFLFGGKKVQRKSDGKGRKVVFIFSKSRSANSMTSRLFDSNPNFLHFLEPFSAWRERKTADRSLTANVDFLERLVDCKLTSEEVYSVIAQGAAVPEDLRTQRIPSMSAVDQLSGLCADRHIAVKTVRQSTLAPICELQRRLSQRGDELYVVDSYRDPRAVVASLMEAAPDALSSIPDAKRVKKISESACQHMAARYKADARECKGLTKYSLQNEHFAKDPVREGEKLYKFIGLKMPSEVRSDLKVAKQEEEASRSPRENIGNRTAAAEVEEAEGKQQQQPAAAEDVVPGKVWSDILSQMEGKEVQTVCKAIMPAKLFKMVFVAN